MLIYTLEMADALRNLKAGIFQALAHPTRIAIVDALREGEMGAGRLAELLHVEQANLSQHLAVLRGRRVVVNRRAGNQVYYSVRDPVLLQVLDLLRQYFLSHLNETLALLDEAGQDQTPA
jgi:DNA-binding transcriptional ArsR family regulator